MYHTIDYEFNDGRQFPFSSFIPSLGEGNLKITVIDGVFQLAYRDQFLGEAFEHEQRVFVHWRHSSIGSAYNMIATRLAGVLMNLSATIMIKPCDSDEYNRVKSIVSGSGSSPEP